MAAPRKQAVVVKAAAAPKGATTLVALPRTHGVLSIRWIATTIAVVLTVAAVVGVGAVAERNSRRALDHEIRARLQLQARNLAASSSSAFQPATAHAWC